MTATEDFDRFFKEPAPVPCNGCQQCCKNEEVVLKPEDGDIVENYITVQSIDLAKGEIVHVLARKENGDCVYLGAGGCIIYEGRPQVCRFYDCRVAFLTFTRRMRAGNPDPKFAEGKKRLHTLDSARRRMAIAVRKFREGVSK